MLHTRLLGRLQDLGPVHLTGAQCHIVVRIGSAIVETRRYALLQVFQMHQLPTTGILGQPSGGIFTGVLDPKDVHFEGHVARVGLPNKNVHRLLA